MSVIYIWNNSRTLYVCEYDERGPEKGLLIRVTPIDIACILNLVDEHHRIRNHKDTELGSQ